MHTTRRLTRAERLAVIDLKVPGDDWQKGRVTMMFQHMVTQPWALDFDDCMEARMLFGHWDDEDHDFDPNDLV